MATVAGRDTLAADTIPNTPEELFRWIQNPQSIKPGVKMPGLGLGLGPEKFHAIVSYLTGLK
jgi:cytochrome c oxidase subunit 2